MSAITTPTLSELRKLRAPKDFTLVQSDASIGLEVFMNVDKTCVMAFVGRAAKPSRYYRYRNAESAAAATGEWVKSLQDSHAKKVEARQARKEATNPHGVGAVLSCSWGYEQTNVDYYEVVKTVGKSTVEIRPIAREIMATGSDQGQCIPVPGVYTGEAVRRRVDQYGCARLDSSRRLHPVKFAEVCGVKIYEAAYWSSYH